MMIGLPMICVEEQEVVGKGSFPWIRNAELGTQLELGRMAFVVERETLLKMVFC